MPESHLTNSQLVDRIGKIDGDVLGDRPQVWVSVLVLAVALSGCFSVRQGYVGDELPRSAVAVIMAPKCGHVENDLAAATVEASLRKVRMAVPAGPNTVTVAYCRAFLATVSVTDELAWRNRGERPSGPATKPRCAITFDAIPGRLYRATTQMVGDPRNRTGRTFIRRVLRQQFKATIVDAESGEVVGTCG